MPYVRQLSRGCAIFVAVAFLPLIASAQYAEQNVNMVSGTQWPGGDPFLRQQNEPSIAVSTRNPMHLLVGSNDYRSVDIPFNAPPRPDEEETGDAWLGVFKSKDGGNTWTSTLLDGYPQQSPSTSPLHGFQAAADPVVRAANNGLFYYAGIVLNRGNNPLGGVFVARFIDNNNQAADPIAYLNTTMIDQGTSGQFIDKPWMAVSPVKNGAQCTVSGQTIDARNVYLAYSVFVGNDNNIRTRIMFTRSTDCGATWAQPQKLSETYTINQGVNIAVDPTSGAVYVAWRRFAGGSDPDSIIVAKSTNAGGSFGKGVVAANITPFEQGTGTANIRTNAYPAMAVDNSGRVYIAWSQRIAVTGDPAITDGRIVMMNSADGQTGWSSPLPVSPIIGGTSNGRGHQFMPAMTFAAGRLTLTWYDLRDDQSIATYTKSNSNPFDGTYTAKRTAVGNLALFQPEVVFWNYMADVSPTAQSPKLVRRHTLDVYAAESAGGLMPSFSNSARVTRYKFGALPPSYSTIQDLQIDPPNLPMFRQGTVPFFGDYIDLAAYSAVPGAARVRHVVWTDNRDVRAPLGNPPDWTKYTPVHSPSLGFSSIFDPNQQPPLCVEDNFGNALNAGSRNQNIYTTRVTDGLFAGSPRNARALGNNITRTFVVFVQNTKSVETAYTLTIVAPAAGTASFLQFSQLGTIDVAIPAHSTATRTVFVNAPPLTEVDVNVNEKTANGLSTVVSLNSDPTNPDIGNPDIGNNEILNPDIGNPDIGNPDIGNPDIGNPDIGNPDIGNPDIGNPDIGNPDIGNPDIGNPDIGNPDIGNPDIGNGSVTDTSWTTTNDGNTTGGYTVKFLSNQEVPNTLKTQLIISKIYDTPAARGCDLGVEHVRQIVTSTKVLPIVSNVSELNDPSLAIATNASTLWLAPGESGRITVRLIDPKNKGLTLDASTFVTPVAIPHAVNTADVANGITTPRISLVITTQRANDAVTNAAYSTKFDAIGGVKPYAWTINPQGLLIDSTGLVTGSFNTPGTNVFNVTVTDASGHSATRQFSIRVVDPLVITRQSLPTGVVGSPYTQTMTSTGGLAQITWTLLGATTLPAGLTLGSDGTISGTPTTALTSKPIFVATDSSVPPQVKQQEISVDVVANSLNIVWIVQPVSAPADQGIPVSVRIQDTTGAVIPGANVALTLASNPGGSSLSLNAVSNVDGTASFTVTGLNVANGYTLQASVTAIGFGPASSISQSFDVTPATLFIATKVLPDAYQDPQTAYTGRLDATGGTPPYHWKYAGGTPPAGMTLNDDGSFSGTPAEVNFVIFTVQVTDSAATPQVAQGRFPMQTWAAPSVFCTAGTFPLFNNWNTSAVAGDGSTPTIIAQGRPNGYNITAMANYHVTSGATGATIGLLTAAGAPIGPFGAAIQAASPGFENWVADSPRGTLNGTYTVTDSDLRTWAENAQSGLKGFTVVCVTPN